MGKGAFDGTDELYTGMLGMHGTKTSNFGVSECDLLIAVGCPFQRPCDSAMPSKFAKNAKILQIDVDPAEINKNIRVDASCDRRPERNFESGSTRNCRSWSMKSG